MDRKGSTVSFVVTLLKSNIHSTPPPASGRKYVYTVQNHNPQQLDITRRAAGKHG
ncbi:hypothetical protein FRC03_010218 [Tulasnella sp. 419]|nr:hypothetical protein FRC03_010218 [Tulasnella sp. 419]